MNDEVIAGRAAAAPAQHWLTPQDKQLMRDLRYLLRENQTEFWNRFGVTQSSGSRFERGLPIPLPVLLLIRLYLLRVVTDDDLAQARVPAPAPAHDGAPLHALRGAVSQAG